MLERFSHETWGQRRNATGWTDAATPPTSNHTTRGFTGHEELDLVGLVHMNGRVYDPALGRFTSADPTIQFADNPQSYNRYSYVLNNPLSFTDPSGYGLFSFFKKLFKKIVKVVKKIFRVVKSFLKHPEMLAALVIASIPGAGWASAFGLSSYPTTAAFTQGFASGLVASKGDLDDGLISAVTAVGFSSMHGWDVKNASFADKALKATAHGAVGGLSSLAQGGSFQSGFLSAGTVQAFSSSNLFDKMGATSNPDGFGDYAANATLAAIVGGTASVIGGGEFANGAVTGAFSRLFNDLWVITTEGEAHAGLYFSDGSSRILMDKGGSYRPSWWHPDQPPNSDGMYYLEEADLADYLRYQRATSDSVHLQYIKTSPREDRLLKDALEITGNSVPNVGGFCAAACSRVISILPQYKQLENSAHFLALPRSLRKTITDIQESLRK